MNTVSRIALAAIFATSMLAAPAVYAEGGTSSGGSSGANAGSSSDKTDKSAQENANSADKDKQQK